LMDSGTIRTSVMVDPFRLGYTIMALIGIQVEHRHLNSIIKELSTLNGLRFIGLTLGRYDVLTEAWFRSNEELLSFVTNILGQIQGIQRTETLQVLKLVKYGYDWGQTSQDINTSP
jgi:Lrp/AsnC family transcriptional regulator, regulator for asnA, asnC and gidA